MTEAEWDDVVRVHLEGHFMPTRWAPPRTGASRPRRAQPVKASVINTSSTSGLFGNVGQTNYGAAKTGIATFTHIANTELERYGVRCNAIAPAALTRLTEDLHRRDRAAGAQPASSTRATRPTSRRSSPTWPPRTARSPGGCSGCAGGEVALFQPFAIVDTINTDGRWTIEDLKKEAARFATFEFNLGRPY